MGICMCSAQQNHRIRKVHDAFCKTCQDPSYEGCQNCLLHIVMNEIAGFNVE